MFSDKVSKIKIENHGVACALWFMGWLFTIGFLELTFWKGVLALLLWPYYLGEFFKPIEKIASLL